MKTNVLGITSFVISIFLFGYSNFNLKEAKNLRSESDQNSNIHADNISLAEPFQITYDNAFVERGDGYKIPDSLAKERILNYIEHIITVRDTLKNIEAMKDDIDYLVYGQSVAIDEFKEIISAANDENNNLYVMSGINDSLNETDAIFALETINDSVQGIPVITWDYYDFTRPCPQICPELEWLQPYIGKN